MSRSIVVKFIEDLIKVQIKNSKVLIFYSTKKKFSSAVHF
jgi:hypothetical protein